MPRRAKKGLSLITTLDYRDGWNLAQIGLQNAIIVKYTNASKFKSHDRDVIDHGFFAKPEASPEASHFKTDEYQVRKRATSLLRLSAN
jgi:hypothetical protein